MTKLNLEKIKCVITDFDRTLYSGARNDETEGYYLDYLKSRGILPKSRKTLGKILEKRPVYHNLQCVVEFMKNKGLPLDDFFEYMGQVPYDFVVPGMEIVDGKIIEKLSKKYKLYLLSDSSVGYIDYYLDLFKYKKNWFFECISNTYEHEDMSKKFYMAQIIKSTGLEPDEILMVGDSERFDIETAQSLNMQTFLVKDVHDTEYIFNELIDLKN